MFGIACRGILVVVPVCRDGNVGLGIGRLVLRVGGGVDGVGFVMGRDGGRENRGCR
jgi:hypothetical protein